MLPRCRRIALGCTTGVNLDQTQIHYEGSERLMSKGIAVFASVALIFGREADRKFSGPAIASALKHHTTVFFISTHLHISFAPFLFVSDVHEKIRVAGRQQALQRVLLIC